MDLVTELTSAVPSFKLDSFDIVVITAAVTCFIIPGYFYYIFKMVLMNWNLINAVQFFVFGGIILTMMEILNFAVVYYTN